jgi:hypothetical protein
MCRRQLYDECRRTHKRATFDECIRHMDYIDKGGNMASKYAVLQGTSKWERDYFSRVVPNSTEQLYHSVTLR